MTELTHGSLFTGYGGLDMAVEAVLGAQTVWVCDNDSGPRKILDHRYPCLPNLGDITEVDWRAVEPVDVISGGSPCQDLSTAGRRAGMSEGTRSNLWVSMREAVNVIRPRYVVWENVRGALSAAADSDLGWSEGLLDLREPDQLPKKDDRALRAMGRILGDLAELGYDAQWVGLRASDVGAPHQRYRVFLLAHAADAERGRGDEGLAQDGGCAKGRDRPGDPDQSPCGYLRARSDVGERGRAPVADADDPGLEGRAADHERADQRPTGPGGLAIQWGRYEPAIRRWEQVTRNPAPSPVDERGRLTARFPEWMMGLPPGWVADVPGITRTEALRAIGNGVVPQQAAAALQYLTDWQRLW